MARGKRRSAVVVLANVFVFALLLLCLEVGARLFFPRSLETLFDDPGVFLRGRPFVVDDGERGFALRPGFEAEDCRINSAGFRGVELEERSAAGKIILVLGESTTFGWRVADAETYPARLEELLRDEVGPGSVTIVNAGVPSYTSAQVLLYLRELVPELEPDLVLVNIFWNDLLYSCLENWLPEYLIIQQPAPWRQFLLRHSGIYRALVIKAESEIAEGGRVNQRALAYYRQNLAEMIGECERHGIRLAFITPPFDPDRIPARGLRIRKDQFVSRRFLGELERRFVGTMVEVAREHRVPVIDHRLAAGGGESGAAGWFIDLVHPSPTGYRLMAEDISDFLLENGLVSPVAGAGRESMSRGGSADTVGARERPPVRGAHE